MIAGDEPGYSGTISIDGRLGVMRHLRHETEAAKSLCQLSHDIAAGAGLPILAAEALNALAGFDLDLGMQAG